MDTVTGGRFWASPDDMGVSTWHGGKHLSVANQPLSDYFKLSNLHGRWETRSEIEAWDKLLFLGPGGPMQQLGTRDASFGPMLGPVTCSEQTNWNREHSLH